jgi:chromosomal replication initiation ATPase DnaA
MELRQYVLDLSLPAALERGDFLVAPSNEAAVHWLDRWPDWPAPALALWGPPGCGKSHLAQIWRSRAKAPRIAPAALAVDAVPALLGAAAAAVVDDAAQAPEEALLHLHNLLAERRGHLLIVAREPPARWPIALPDLRSRLVAAPAVAIDRADDELLAKVLRKLFADRRRRVSEETIRWLVMHVERSFDAARRAVAALEEAAVSTRRKIGPALARDVLGMAEEEG